MLPHFYIVFVPRHITFVSKIKHLIINNKNNIRKERKLNETKANRISILLVSELSRLGRNAFEVLASVKEIIDRGINLYIQKEQLTLLDDEGHPSLFAPIMIATLSTLNMLLLK